MLRCNETITVVNSYHDTDADCDVYLCHTFCGCSWYSKEQRTVDASGLHKATIHQIRIPEAAASGVLFCSPQDWAKLTNTERSAAWTLGRNAVLLKGAVERLTEAQFAALSSSYTMAGGLSWHDNRGGCNPHWYAEGS